MTEPKTRAEARAIQPEFDPFTEIESPTGEFLPLAARRVLYVMGLAGAVVAPVVAVTQPDYAAAIVSAAGILTAAAIGTALANPPR